MRTKKISLIAILWLAIVAATSAQSVGTLTGIIIDKSNQSPIEFVSVSLTGTQWAASTDSTGRFILNDITPGTYELDITYLGYKDKKLYNIIITSGNDYNVTIELDAESQLIDEVVVKASKRTVYTTSIETPLSIQKLTLEEIKSNPGGNFDISKAIQVLPGVGGGVGGGGFRNDIIIRGGAPNENVFYLDGIEIPVINHFQTQGSSGGPQGMLNVSFLEDVKLSSSAFDAKYDNALSSVFQFKQKNGNALRLQGNVRLSASELAATLEGPLGRSKRTTFLASARRSYLQLLFSLIDLPIRPNYWDFQTKINHQIDKKTTLSFIGLGAIDEFSFAKIKSATPEKQYIYNSNPIINQWNYTIGVSLKRLMDGGYYNLSLSRNTFDNDLIRYEDNEAKNPDQLTLDYQSREIENKLRFDVNKQYGRWKLAYGASAQYVEYNSRINTIIRKQLSDSLGQVIQPGIALNTSSNLSHMTKYGFFAQLGTELIQGLKMSIGLRTDGNSFTNDGHDLISRLSPRMSLSYAVTSQVNANVTIGRYFKLPPYTILGFTDNNNQLVNQSAQYLSSNHVTAGIEYLPQDHIRLTVEGFYKQYANVPVSMMNGISLSNLGSDFNVLGNEAVTTDGKGRAYGLEIFAQKKLTRKFFGILSYTFYRSEYSGADGKYIASSWDNRHLLSLGGGYKLGRSWELGLRFRMQGGAPYTPYDEVASRINYLSLGQGLLDYSRLNTQRLASFHSSDIRIDKKWNFRKTTIDFFIDITNWYGAKTVEPATYTFTRTDDNSGFVTTDGKPLSPIGSNALPVLLNDNQAQVTPTLGLIVEF